MVASEGLKWTAGAVIPLQECNWTHISVTWSKTNGLKVYKNGELSNCHKLGINVTNQLLLAGQSYLLFGSFYNYSSASGHFKISKLGFWKSELEQSDITGIYSTGKTRMKKDISSN